MLTLDPGQHRTLAAELWQAECGALPVEPLTARFEALAEQDAYAIQGEVAQLRRDRGDRVVGKKIGLTSRAMQEMAGVLEPDFGLLFASMEVPDGGTIDSGALIAPMVEPEIAFVLRNTLAGPGVTPRQVLAATDFVAPAFEVVDSRIAEWRIAWHDTVADNGSSSRFVLGSRAYSPKGLDFESLGVVMRRNGRRESMGSMRAVLGSPLHSVCWLVTKLSAYGLALEPGDVVLPGSPCRAVPAHDGDRFQADFGPLGTIRVDFARLAQGDDRPAG